jgi:hypothetical protein
MALPLTIMLSGSQVECHSKFTYNFTQHNGQGLDYILKFTSIFILALANLEATKQIHLKMVVVKWHKNF